jgi:aryl-alcohol dehydrogenase-like predicted oxidoreductase
MKLALGTAQFGLDYGVTNNDGKVPLKIVGELLEFAKLNGIRVIDTAIAYGNSEQVLGNFDLSSFSVVSKIPDLSRANQSIESMVSGSLERLRIGSLYGLLFHSEDDVVHPAYVHQLKELKEGGVIQKVGASFYCPNKALEAINTEQVDIIQVPANQLDQRFEKAGVFQAAKEFGVEVHIRSLFLQGLLAVKNNRRPTKFKEHTDLLRYDVYSETHDLLPIALALEYLLSRTQVSFGVIGCANVRQLTEIINLYNELSVSERRQTFDLSSDDEHLLNPSTW